MKFSKSIFAIFNLLSASQAEIDLRGCDEIVITDCDRNYCQIQAEPDIYIADICQSICQSFDNSDCQSWAYSTDNKVSLLHFFHLFRRTIKMGFLL